VVIKDATPLNPPYSINETPFSNVNNINEFRGIEKYYYTMM